MPTNASLTYHLDTIAKFPADTWVLPTNNNSNDYSVFADLYEFGYAEKKVVSVYNGKQLVGNKIYFKYKPTIYLL